MTAPLDLVDRKALLEALNALNSRYRLDIDNVSRAVRALLSYAAPAEDSWLPIETAPKDGRTIILTDGQSVEADRWVNWPIDRSESWDRMRYLTPTLWRPMPAPPAAPGAK